MKLPFRAFQVRAALAAFFTVATALFALEADAQTTPSSSIVEVRREAIVLLADRVNSAHADPASVSLSGVVVAGNQALLSWKSSNARGVMGLVFQRGHWWDAYDAYPVFGWWLVGAVSPLREIAPSYDATTLGPVNLRAEGFTPQLVALALRSNADVTADSRQSIELPDGKVFQPQPDIDVWCFGVCGTVMPKGSTVFTIPDATSGFSIRLDFGPNDAANHTRLLIDVRRGIPGQINSIVAFSAEPQSQRTIKFPPGTALSVWCPFALDRLGRYTLSFASGGKPVQTLLGTLDGLNVLHFTLPTFSVSSRMPITAQIFVTHT